LISKQIEDVFKRSGDKVLYHLRRYLYSVGVVCIRNRL